MTSQKSSANPRFYTFRTTLASNFLLPLLNMLALTFLMPVMNFLFLKEFGDRSASMGQNAASATLKETYKYLLFPEASSYSAFAIIVTVGCSVLLGVMMFRFIASKKTVNVYYSLGITRKALFLSKYLAGVLMLAVAVAVPLLINLILNFSYLGSSWQLWSATAYYFWSFSILACFSFTVTAAVFSCVGTVAEGCFFPLAILGAPMIVLYCLQYLMETLFGNPYGHYFMGYSSVDLPTAFKSFNPLLFLYDGVNNLSLLDAEGKLVPSMYGGEGIVWSKPDFLPLILWTLAIVAVMFLGMHLFKKRKAEICGFLGANSAMNFLITFLLGLLGFGLSIHFVADKLPLALAILIGLAVYAVIYCIVDLALIRNWKDFLHGFVKLPIHLGISLVIGVVFATGFFGFSTRVPELSEIKSAAITVPSDTFLGVGCSGSSWGADYSWGALGNMLDGLTEEADINFVRQLHEQIVESGDQELTVNQPGVAREDQVSWATIQVVYELKNGRRLLRHYNNVPVKAVTQLLNVEDTEAGKEQIRSLLTEAPVQTAGYGEGWITQTIQEKGAILLLSPYMEKETPITLSTEQRKVLLQCIADDLTAQKAAQRYFPTKPLIGLITIHNSESGSYDSAGGTNRSPSSASYTGYTVYLTEDMQKTIQFLQANGLYDSIGQPAEVESVEVVRAMEERSYYRDDLEYESFFFIGGWQSQKMFEENQKNEVEMAAQGYYDNNNKPMLGNAVKIEDAKQAQEVASLSHISYFYGVDGYFVRAKLAGGQGYTCMFLPESVAPQYVKDAVK